MSNNKVTNVADPTADGDAVNKKYVDDAVQNATDTELEGRVEALETSQGTQDSKITALETAQTEQESRLDDMENGTTALPYLKKTGDTGTGTFNFTGAALQIAEPTQNNNPASKQYVDQAVAAASNPSGSNGHIVFEDAIFIEADRAATITKESNERVCVLTFSTYASDTGGGDYASSFLWDNALSQYFYVHGFTLSSVSNTSLTLHATTNGVIVRYKFVSDN